MARLDFEAIVSGRVNGVQISVEGSGVIDEAQGATTGLYDIRGLPAFFAPGLLTACILTGYPNATATGAGQINPFQGRSYDYDRSLHFGFGERLVYTAACQLEAGRLLSHFRLEGEVPIVRLPRDFVQHIEERWWVDSGGRLAGEFTAPWQTEDASVLTAAAKSEYRLAVGSATRAFRRLKLEASTDGNVFRLHQESRLIS